MRTDVDVDGESEEALASCITPRRPRINILITSETNMIASSRNNILFEVGIADVCVEYEIYGVVVHTASRSSSP